MGKNKIHAVLDTNVIVSAFISNNFDSNPTIVLRETLRGKITPVYNDEILNEYEEVLSRDKFRFQRSDIDLVINHVRSSGLKVERTKVLEEIFPDKKDIVFYEVAMSKDDAYLVTGNIKHFPQKPFVVTPAEMVEILNM